VRVAETPFPGTPRVHDDDRRLIPRQGPVGLGRVGGDRVGADLERLDRRLGPNRGQGHRPGRNSSTFCLNDCVMISLALGSPPSSAELSALACSSVMWGGSGGTSGSVTASWPTGRPAA